MDRTPAHPLAAGLAVVVACLALLAGVTWMTTRGDDDRDHGSDAHEMIDPTADAAGTAVAVMAGLNSWSPATQRSPWDAMPPLADKLTGPLAQAAAARPTPDPTPSQWAAWAAAGDRVIGTAERVPGTPAVPDDASTATIPIRVKQVVMHPSGQTTPREAMTADVEVVRDNGTWKASTFRYRPLTSK